MANKSGPMSDKPRLNEWGNAESHLVAAQERIRVLEAQLAEAQAMAEERQVSGGIKLTPLTSAIVGIVARAHIAEHQLAAMRKAGKPMAEVCDFLPGREHLSAAWRKAAGG